MTWANRGAESVLSNNFPSIVAWHESQPDTKKHLEVRRQKNDLLKNRVEEKNSCKSEKRLVDLLDYSRLVTFANSKCGNSQWEEITLCQILVFFTPWANRAAEDVLSNNFANIYAWHKSQPETKK